MTTDLTSSIVDYDNGQFPVTGCYEIADRETEQASQGMAHSITESSHGNGVNDRVEGAVTVTEPCENFHDRNRDALGFADVA